VFCTVNVGYGRASIAEAVRDSAGAHENYLPTRGSVPGARFAERLLEKDARLRCVYYANSGSEANEKVFKMGARSRTVITAAAAQDPVPGARLPWHHARNPRCQWAAASAARNMGHCPPGFVEVPHCLEYRSQYGSVANYGGAGGEGRSRR